MPDYLGRDQRKTKPTGNEEEKVQGSTESISHSNSSNPVETVSLSPGRRRHKDIENIRELKWTESESERINNKWS